MNERIHRYLDGELAREALTEGELSEAAAYEDAVHRTVAAATSESVPDMTRAVMERISGKAPVGSAAREVTGPGWARSLAHLGAWLWSPRPIRLRPAYGLAAAAAVVLVMMITEPGGVPAPEAASGEAEAVAREVFVQFRLDAPEASAVHLAGSFTGWQPEYELHRSAPGVWSLLVPLEPGVHEYAFVVDGGEWTPDPTGPRVSDGFGGENSRVTVLLPNGRSL